MQAVHLRQWAPPWVAPITEYRGWVICLYGTVKDHHYSDCKIRTFSSLRNDTNIQVPADHTPKTKHLWNDSKDLLIFPLTPPKAQYMIFVDPLLNASKKSVQGWRVKHHELSYSPPAFLHRDSSSARAIIAREMAERSPVSEGPTHTSRPIGFIVYYYNESVLVQLGETGIWSRIWLIMLLYTVDCSERSVPWTSDKLTVSIEHCWLMKAHEWKHWLWRQACRTSL